MFSTSIMFKIFKLKIFVQKQKLTKQQCCSLCGGNMQRGFDQQSLASCTKRVFIVMLIPPAILNLSECTERPINAIHLLVVSVMEHICFFYYSNE